MFWFTSTYWSCYKNDDRFAGGDFSATNYPSYQFPGHKQSLQDTVTLINRFHEIQGQDNILYGGIRGEDVLLVDGFLRSIVARSTVHTLWYTEFPLNPGTGTMCISTDIWEGKY